jgi:SsrA-binding protein
MKQVIFNRKAKFNYTTEDKYSSGIILSGNEVKSTKEGKLNFNDSYCLFIDNELWLRGVHISEYKFGRDQTPTRDRKLLLKKKELKKIQEKIKEKGMTIFPICAFTNPKGIIKIEIGIGKGKNLFDKRETIKKRDIEKEVKKSLII